MCWSRTATYWWWSVAFVIQRHFDFPVVEDPQPTGAGWLFHSKTLQSYLNLLSTSQREETQEACCGALQNLTAHEGIVRKDMLCCYTLTRDYFGRACPLNMLFLEFRIWSVFLYSQVSSVMSQTIVQKLNGLRVISPLLRSNKVNIQRNTVALVGNLTKNPNLHNAMGKY